MSRELLQLALETIKDMQGEWPDHEHNCGVVGLIEAELAKPEPEPCDYKLLMGDDVVGHLSPSAYELQKIDISEAGVTVIPLYIAPPARKPLSEDEIHQLAVGKTNPLGGIYSTSIIDFARAIEKAHGIE